MNSVAVIPSWNQKLRHFFQFAIADAEVLSDNECNKYTVYFSLCILHIFFSSIYRKLVFLLWNFVHTTQHM